MLADVVMTLIQHLYYYVILVLNCFLHLSLYAKAVYVSVLVNRCHLL